ncbi:MAG: tyrosine--tRNA ligase [Ardenticatenia bacterium]|nr:tyrosine--tRNA ligase [Ardenticatenia bacterium]
MRGTQYGDEETRRVMERELRERLEEGRPLRVYLGVDPTAPDLHLGHSVPLRKLAQFQELGHECTFLIGDFTAMIGDPSDKDKTRPQLTREQVLANVETYTRQAFKILDPGRTTIRYNSEWLSRLTLADTVRLASHFTVAQFLERENFAKRFERGEAIHLHEFFYALMQGYDAVALETDVQIGGTDQTFNILAGRRIQQLFGQQPQILITLGILPGTDGRLKMSKSLGNAIPIDTTPEDMYGKLMSIPDFAMRTYFDLLTRFHPNEIERLFQELRSGDRHPRDVKMILAREVTAIFFGDAAAAEAEAYFVRVYRQRERPTEMPTYELQEPKNIVDLMAELNLVKSRSEARRLIKQGGVRLDGERVTQFDTVVEPRGTRVLRVGKHTFVALREVETTET